MRHPIRYVAWRTVVLGACLLLFSMALYAWNVQRETRKLINSAAEIRSLADAERQIARWRRASGTYTESQSPDGAGRACSLQKGNGILSTLRIVPSTGVTVEAITHSGKLELVVIGVYTNRSSVWLQEVFGAESSYGIKVNLQRDPNGEVVKALLTFPSGLDENKKHAAFSLNSNCFVTPGGCHAAREFLPTLSEFEFLAPTS